MRYHIFLFPVICMLLSCCGGGRVRTVENGVPAFPREFPAVSVPSMITDPQQAYVHLSFHFWDRYIDSSAVWSIHDDSTMVGGVEKGVLMKEFTAYSQVLWNVPVVKALEAQKRLMDRLEKAALADTSMVGVFDAISGMADKCLYGVNSDFRNEEFYIPVLEKLLSTPLKTPLTENVMKEKYRKELDNCCRNRIGEAASDFIYSRADGVTGHLRDVKGEFILLFFSNPGCSACLEIINSLKSSESVSGLIASGRLKVLNIYIDEDLTEWFKYMPVYPKEWINAYQPDLKVRHDGLYDVRAIPSLYILDEEKKVLFKDVAPNVALNFLEHTEVAFSH